MTSYEILWDFAEDHYGIDTTQEAVAMGIDKHQLPALGGVRVMELEYQVAQKLHGASERGSKRAHDLIDLQLITSQNTIDLAKTASICRQLFKYRRKQPWPATITKNENWDAIYTEQKGSLPVLPTVDEAIIWANDLIQRIANTPATNP